MPKRELCAECHYAECRYAKCRGTDVGDGEKRRLMTSAPGDILDVELPGVERRRGLHRLRPRPQSGRFQVRHQEGIHVLKLF